MFYVAQVIGIFAVIAYLLSYQQRKRIKIIIWNATSRILYIIQYIFLGAFEGAVLDILGVVASLAAQNKNKGFISQHVKLIFIILNLILIVAGAFLFENIYSIFPVIGVMMHTGAFWLNDVKLIRIISLIGSPFWLIYNIISGAYGSAIGDTLTMFSIGIAMFRYDIRKKGDN